MRIPLIGLLTLIATGCGTSTITLRTNQPLTSLESGERAPAGTWTAMVAYAEVTDGSASTTTEQLEPVTGIPQETLIRDVHPRSFQVMLTHMENDHQRVGVGLRYHHRDGVEGAERLTFVLTNTRWWRRLSGETYDVATHNQFGVHLQSDAAGDNRRISYEILSVPMVRVDLHPMLDWHAGVPIHGSMYMKRFWFRTGFRTGIGLKPTDRLRVIGTFTRFTTTTPGIPLLLDDTTARYRRNHPAYGVFDVGMAWNF